MSFIRRQAYCESVQLGKELRETINEELCEKRHKSVDNSDDDDADGDEHGGGGNNDRNIHIKIANKFEKVQHKSSLFSYFI